MPVRRQRGFTRSVARRRTTWARSFGTMSNASAATWDTVDLLANFKADGGNQQGVTVARIHLRLAEVTVPAAGDQFSVGIIRGQNTDVGVTVAGAPSPVLDPYEDWMYWSLFTACNQPGAGSHMFPGGGGCYEVDIKAKRRFEELQQSLNLVTSAPVSGAFPQQIVYSASVLLMLP